MFSSPTMSLLISHTDFILGCSLVSSRVTSSAATRSMAPQIMHRSSTCSYLLKFVGIVTWFV